MGIYFIQAEKGGPIKIGLARKNPTARISSIQAANYVDLQFLAFTDGGLREEKALHQKFANLQIRGEWFRPADELLEFIRTLPPPPARALKKKRGITGRWSRLAPEQITAITAMWFDQTIKTDFAVSKFFRMPYQTIRNNLGPSGRVYSMTPEFAAKMQKASVSARTKGRMPAREALKIWRNPELSTAEAIDLMTGWAQATAYNQLGSRGVPAGRRRK